MMVQGNKTTGALSREFGAYLLYTSLASLHIYLCVHAFIKYQESALAVRKTRAHYVRVMCATLFFSTVTFALDLARFYVEMLNEENMVVSANLVMYLEILFFVFIGLTHLTADGLLAWRCYVIWTGQSSWIGLAPLVPYAASVGMGILVLISSTICAKRDPMNIICKNQGAIRIRGTYFIVATSVNLTATVLICVRLLRAKRGMKEALAWTIPQTGVVERVGSSAIPYGRVTMVLMESALPFTMLGVVAAILAFLDSAFAQDTRIFTSRLWTMASGLTSQVIIYRVITGISWTSTHEQDRDALSHAINFAHSNVPSSISGPSSSRNDAS